MADDTITLERLKQEFDAQSGSQEENAIIAAWARLRALHQVQHGPDGGIEEAARCVAMRIAALYLAPKQAGNVAAELRGQQGETPADGGQVACECVRPSLILNGGDPWCTACNRWRLDLTCGCRTE